MRSLRKLREKIDKRLQILERAYAELSGVETETTAVTNGSLRPMGNNRKVIVSILGNNGGPMAVRDIANKAFQSGLIRSPNGYKGVYNIVQTVLRRNKGTTFSKVDLGTWDLRARRLEKRTTKSSVKVQRNTKNEVLDNA